MRRISRVIFSAALLIGLLPVAAQAEPHCVVMKFFDKQGVAIPTPEPVIAIMIGGKPAAIVDVPAAASRQPGAEIACPDALVADVQTLFEQSCLTEQRRNQAVIDNRQQRSVVDKGCLDMAQTLGSKLQPTP